MGANPGRMRGGGIYPQYFSSVSLTEFDWAKHAKFNRIDHFQYEITKMLSTIFHHNHRILPTLWYSNFTLDI